MSEKVTVFYSWQSDTPGKVNRNFIEDALREALKRLHADATVAMALRDAKIELDKDTQNVPGSPPIAETILRKIDECAVFVADLTFVGESKQSLVSTGEKPRQFANPNVLIEYGYALRRHSHSAVIGVMNTAYGKPDEESLPFDLRHLRWPITYYFEGGASKDKEAYQELVSALEKAIKLVLASRPASNVGAGAAVDLNDAQSSYLAAQKIVNAGDVAGWRELVKKARQPMSGRLNDWRKRFDGTTGIPSKELPGIVLEAATICSPLMAIALVGVESGDAKFNKHSALLEDFLQPRDWNTAGLVVIGSIPESLVFTFQALHGAACVQASELSLAIGLSRTRVTRLHHFDGVALHQDFRFIALPESFGNSPEIAWRFLVELPDKWSWLSRIFGTVEDYQVCLCTYYMALNIQELACRIANEKNQEIAEDPYLDVPPMWLRMGHDIERRAYTALVDADSQTRAIWRSLPVSDKQIADRWPAWVEKSVRWHSGVRPLPSFRKPVNRTLFEDLRPEELE